MDQWFNEADELDVVMLCLEENIEEEIANTSYEDLDALDSVYEDPCTIEPDDSELDPIGIDVEEDLNDEFAMIEDDVDDEIMEYVESE